MSTDASHCTTGVYLIKNTITGAVYIGSAARSFDHRWGEHKRSLRKGKHENRYLQRAWNKYGEHAFTFTVAEYVADPTQVLGREQAWIDRYFGLGPQYCYNLTPTAGSVLGLRLSEEQRQRRSKIMKGRKKPQSFIDAVSKTYDGFVGPDGTIYAPVTNLFAFASEHGLHAAHLTEIAAGKRQSANGWRRIDAAPPKVYSYAFIAPDGTVYSNITNLTAFCREHQVDAPNMHGVHTGRLKKHKGWRKAPD